MDEQRLEPIYNSSVLIDVALKTYRDRWQIEKGGRREGLGDLCWRHDMMIHLAKSAGAVEYTGCISAEGYDSTNEYLGYDNKQSDD